MIAANRFVASAVILAGGMDWSDGTHFQTQLRQT